jgi:hypothetical protein
MISVATVEALGRLLASEGSGLVYRGGHPEVDRREET